MPDLLETPPANPIPKQLLGYQFTSANATLMAARSVEARRKRNANQIPQTLTPDGTLDDFNRLRLVRVRGQLEKLDAMMVKETDPQKLDRLASAQARLSEQERILAGRPLPGSRRPREDRTRVSAGWIELKPALPSAPGPQVAPAPTRPEVACLDCLATAPAQAVVLGKPLGWEYDDPTPAVLEPTPQPVVVAPIS